MGARNEVGGILPENEKKMKKWRQNTVVTRKPKFPFWDINLVCDWSKFFVPPHLPSARKIMIPNYKKVMTFPQISIKN